MASTTAQTLPDRQLELGQRPSTAMSAAPLSTDTPPLDQVAPALRAAAAGLPAQRPVRTLPIERLSLD